MASNSPKLENFNFKHSTHFGDMFGLFEEFYRAKTLTDVLIACEGRNIYAHKIVLSAGSEHFRRILSNVSASHQMPILVMNDVASDVMELLVQFMYRGQIVVPRNKVDLLRQAAGKLRIKGFENFIRKQYYSNGVVPVPPTKVNGNSNSRSLLNHDNKRTMSQNDLHENKRMRMSNGQENAVMQQMLMNRYRDEFQTNQANLFLQAALQRGSALNGNNKKIEQIMKQLKNSESFTITPLNGDANKNGHADDSSEIMENHKNENVENEKLKNGDGSNGEDEEYESDEEQEVNYTYELDPSALAQWDNSGAEETGLLDGSNLDETGEGADEEDYFESINRSQALEMILQQQIKSINGQMNGSGQMHTCEHCQKVYFDESQLQLHIKRSHGVNKLNICEMCGKTYAWKSGLYKHKRHVHGIVSSKSVPVNNHIMSMAEMNDSKESNIKEESDDSPDQQDIDSPIQEQA